MTEFLGLREAIQRYVRPGASVALEGFTHLIPHAAGLEIIRQKITGLTLIRMTPDIVYDQLIGMGCADKLKFSWGGNPGVGSLHRFRDAIEHGHPKRLEIEEHTHAAMANAYAAGAANLPCAVFRGYRGTTYPDVNPMIRFIECPFTGDTLTAVPAIRPDVSIIHAQQADRQGNVRLRGIIGIQKEAVLSARHSIVTVEEIVDRVDDRQGGVILPYWVVSAVCLEPKGAFPSYAEGYYDRANEFYMDWDAISCDRDRFQEWMDRFVLLTANFAEFMAEFEERVYA